jgi:hypothetical protein
MLFVLRTSLEFIIIQARQTIQIFQLQIYALIFARLLNPLIFRINRGGADLFVRKLVAGVLGFAISSSNELTCIFQSQGVTAFSGPVREPGFSGRRRFDEKEIGHQAFDFFPRDHHVVDEFADEPAGSISQ